MENKTCSKCGVRQPESKGGSKSQCVVCGILKSMRNKGDGSKVTKTAGMRKSLGPGGAKEYMKKYIKHSALNAGQAARDVRHITDFPGAKSTGDSVKKRLKSLANNLKYTALPPTEIKVGKRTLMKGHHSMDEMNGMSKKTVTQWFKDGYNV